MPDRLTPESAIMLIAGWIMSHGRDPKAKECHNGNGLPCVTTFLYGCGFSAYGQVLSAAHEYIENGMLSATSTTKLSAPCMGGCGHQVQFRREEPIRHCEKCRQRLLNNDNGIDDNTPTLHAIDTWFLDTDMDCDDNLDCIDMTGLWEEDP